MRNTGLIGYSGFVGSNLARQTSFETLYNSKNIAEIEGRSFDLLVCAGVSAVKWWANQHPEEDRQAIDRLLGPLATVRAHKAILISTVDVYPVAVGADETFVCAGKANHAYGTHRLCVEEFFQNRFTDLHIVRLPGLFGPGLRKNVIYDLMNDNCLDAINPESSFQYYDTRRLWSDIEKTIGLGLRLVNFVTEPVETRLIIDRYFAGKNVGASAGRKGAYDLRSVYAAQFGGVNGYMANAEEVLAQLGSYLSESRRAI